MVEEVGAEEVVTSREVVGSFVRFCFSLLSFSG